jgi:hypothetical protein
MIYNASFAPGLGTNKISEIEIAVLNSYSTIRKIQKYHVHLALAE